MMPQLPRGFEVARGLGGFRLSQNVERPNPDSGLTASLAITFDTFDDDRRGDSLA